MTTKKCEHGDRCHETFHSHDSAKLSPEKLALARLAASWGVVVYEGAGRSPYVESVTVADLVEHIDAQAEANDCRVQTVQAQAKEIERLRAKVVEADERHSVTWRERDEARAEVERLQERNTGLLTAYEGAVAELSSLRARLAAVERTRQADKEAIARFKETAEHWHGRWTRLREEHADLAEGRAELVSRLAQVEASNDRQSKLASNLWHWMRENVGDDLQAVIDAHEIPREGESRGEPVTVCARDVIARLRARLAEIAHAVGVDDCREGLSCVPGPTERVVEEIRSMRRGRDRLAELERHLGNLLARIHRDGGHHQNLVGTEQAVKDADAQIVAWLGQADKLAESQAREARLRSALEDAQKALDWEGSNWPAGNGETARKASHRALDVLETASPSAALDAVRSVQRLLPHVRKSFRTEEDEAALARVFGEAS